MIKIQILKSVRGGFGIFTGCVMLGLFGLPSSAQAKGIAVKGPIARYVLSQTQQGKEIELIWSQLSVESQQKLLAEIEKRAAIAGARVQVAGIESHIHLGQRQMTEVMQGLAKELFTLDNYAASLGRFEFVPLRKGNLEKLQRAFANGNLMNRRSILETLKSTSQFEGATLRAMRLENVNIENGLNLAYADLRFSSLTESRFVHLDLRGAQLGHAQLDRVQLIDCALMEADLKAASLRDATLSRVRLNNADFRYADLEGASLQHASLNGSNFQSANLRNSQFSLGADLTGVDLRGADLRGADLATAFVSPTTLLQGAKIDAQTRLPFTLEVAVKRYDMILK